MESWGPTGLGKATFAPLLKSITFRMWGIRWFISPMMPYRNTVIAMASMKRAIKCPTTNFRGTWTQQWVRVSLVSVKWSTPKWELLPLMPSRQPTWKWTQTTLSIILRSLGSTLWSTATTRCGWLRSTQTLAFSCRASCWKEWSLLCSSRPSDWLSMCFSLHRQTTPTRRSTWLQTIPSKDFNSSWFSTRLGTVRRLRSCIKTLRFWTWVTLTRRTRLTRVMGRRLSSIMNFLDRNKWFW